MMSHQTMQSWSIMVTTAAALGIADMFFNLLNGMAVFLLYITIGLLGKAGFPVWANPLSGWGWPEPNIFGYGAGISLWFIGLYVLAEMRTPPEKSPVQKIDI